jgi:hypothetical protein
MSSSTTIYRYLNEEKISIYNDNRNIRDRLKYNLDDEYKQKIKEKNKKAYLKKKEAEKKAKELENKAIKEVEEEYKEYEEKFNKPYEGHFCGLWQFLNDKDNYFEEKAKIIEARKKAKEEAEKI